jgi:hypothetical protein
MPQQCHFGALLVNLPAQNYDALLSDLSKKYSESDLHCVAGCRETRHGDFSPGSELKAGEDACHEASQGRTMNGSNVANGFAT